MKFAITIKCGSKEFHEGVDCQEDLILLLGRLKVMAVSRGAGNFEDELFRKPAKASHDVHGPPGSDRTA